MRRVFIFGAGYSGRAIARVLAHKADSIAGTTRSAEKAEALARMGIKPLIYAEGGFTPELTGTLRETTHLILSIAPGENGDAVLAELIRRGRGAMPNLQWICYLSTVGVYGDHNCAEVTEESECQPISARSHRRLETEKAWSRFGDEIGVPVAILRLSGIYGPGRNAIVNLVEGAARRIVKPGQVFNRIHVDDIAGAARHLLNAKAHGTFNVSDDEPSPPQDVVAFAAHLTGVEPAPEIPFEEAKLSPMARSFYSECKRVSNAKLKGLGYSLRYPNYREGLSALWKTGLWRG
ncbi:MULTISPECIES: SDR family oxidoreductase [Chelativorans]|jgi:nucleoside-diphosphate-sugar epimerase|uniref:NAD-dependent epimerase/dehydratase n=1 Tax=Chelativorans sp. (strain BNC1) TaxID=266779 RepID=Q11CA9_CHESB|nr:MULTISPECIES: SDR family oxidoreductase [Chelativorans]